MSLLEPLRGDQRAAEADGRIHQHVFRWLMRLRDLVRVGVVPIGSIVPAYLTAAQIALYFDATGLGVRGDRYDGWALCNGNNDTPNLAGKFPRFSTTEAAGTGGSDSSAHTHAIDHDHGSFASAAESGHTHSVTSNVTSAANTGSESAHTHGLGAGYAEVHIDGAGTKIEFNLVTGVTEWTGNWAVTKPVDGSTGNSTRATNLGGSTDTGSSHSHTAPALTNNAVTSGASSGHTHSIDVPALTQASGAAAATENRPAYYELVPVMRIA